MPRRVHPMSVSLLLAALSTHGCEPGTAPDRPLWTERDSAGVVIVDNHDAPEIGGAGYAVVGEPVSSIGTLDGDAAQQLYRVSGATRLSDGRIAIGNGGTREVRIYTPAGDFSDAFGGEGEGPGEFKAVRVVGVRGSDSLIVHDRDLRRVSVIHAVDGFVRSFPVGDEAGGYPVSQGMLDDGTLVYGGGVFFSSASGGFPTGVVQMPSLYGAVTIEGEALPGFGEWPSFEMFAQQSGGNFMARSLPFAKGTAAAAGGDRVYIGTSDRYQIDAFDGMGTRLRVIRLDRPGRPVTSTDVARYVSDQIGEADDPNERRQLETVVAQMPVASEMPAFGAMKVDALGLLWVQEHPAPSVEHPEWTIFDRDGHVLGRVRIPDGAQLLEIGADYVLGRVSDDLDVEYVRMWTLERPPAPES